MAIFGTDPQPTPHAVHIVVPPYVVWRSAWTAAAADEHMAIPTYGAWEDISQNMIVGEVSKGSSLTFMSRARLQLSSGAPLPQIDVENARTVLQEGDRVCIGIEQGSGV